MSSCPAAAVAVLLCLWLGLAHLVVLQLHHSFASAADQLPSLALSQLVAVMTAELQGKNDHKTRKMSAS